MNRKEYRELYHQNKSDQPHIMIYKVLLICSVVWTTVKCSAIDDSIEKVNKKHEKNQESHSKKYQYQGKYGGSCNRDGFYYLNEDSFVICSNSNVYVQPCAPGSRNSGLHGYQEGRQYNYHELCDVNLVDLGYGVKFGLDKVRGYGKGGIHAENSYGKDKVEYKKQEYSSYGQIEKGTESSHEGYYEPKESYGYVKEGYATKKHYSSDSKGLKDGYGPVNSKLYGTDNKYSHEMYSADKEQDGYNSDSHYAEPVDVHYGERKVEYQSGHDEQYTESDYGNSNARNPSYQSHKDAQSSYPGNLYGQQEDSYDGSSYEDNVHSHQGSYGTQQTYAFKDQPVNEEHKKLEGGYGAESYSEPRYQTSYGTDVSHKKEDYGHSYHQKETYVEEPYGMKDQQVYEKKGGYGRERLHEHGQGNSYHFDHSNIGNRYDQVHSDYKGSYENRKPGYAEATPSFVQAEYEGPKDGYYSGSYEERNIRVPHGKDEGHNQGYSAQSGQSYDDQYSNGGKTNNH